MNLIYKKFDILDSNFQENFRKYERSFLQLLQNCYQEFYGNSYHSDRIRQSSSIVYLALNNDSLVGASYVKRNLRRGGTVVAPEYRGMGVGEHLVKMSLTDFPHQYSILSTNLNYSHRMLSLMEKVGFKKAMGVEIIKTIVGEEFECMSNFRIENGYFIFDRESKRRNGVKRIGLTLLHTF